MTAFAVIGAGGLGGPVAYALAAAGAGSLTLCDPDAVDLGNLQRQVQFTTADIGRPKVEALADELCRRGLPRAAIRALPIRFAADTADRVLDGADVLVEGSDDPATKFAANDLALARRMPFAIGGVERQAGQVFRGRPGAACYRCLFEDVPDDAPTCGDSGVLGPLVGWIGGVAAGRAARLADGDAAVAGTLWVLDDLRDGRPPRTLTLSRRAGCSCAT